MTDVRVRDLERLAALREPGASAALLNTRLRRGALDELAVEIAALAGDVDARELLGLGEAGELLEGAGAFLARACTSWRERAACLRMGIAAARLLVYAPLEPGRQWREWRASSVLRPLPWMGIRRDAYVDNDGDVLLQMQAWLGEGPWGCQVALFPWEERDPAEHWIRLEDYFLSRAPISIGRHPELVLDAVETAVACPCLEHDSRAHAAGYGIGDDEPFGSLGELVLGRLDNNLPIVLRVVADQVGREAVARAVHREVAAWALGEGDAVRDRVRPELPAR
jgi:hypothetical protein